MIYAFSNPSGTKTLVVEAGDALEAIELLNEAGYVVDDSSMTMGHVIVIAAGQPSTYVSETR